MKTASANKLFLGGLTKATTTKQLFEVFGAYGTVVDAVVMERGGIPRGFGFVTFAEEESVRAVLDGPAVSVGGRAIDVKRAVPEGEMEAAPAKIFVGGLHQKVDRRMLRDHFAKYGEVRDAVVMMDRSTGRSRGFGFVRFTSAEAVHAVLGEAQVLEGCTVDVKQAEPAEALPPPRYPRREEKEKKRERARTPSAPAEADVSAAAMQAAFGALLAQQYSGLAFGYPAFPPAFPMAPPAFPMAPPDFASLFNSSLFPAFDDTNFPAGSPFGDDTATPEFCLGDVSNVLASSPTKRAPSPPLPLGKPLAENALPVL